MSGFAPRKQERDYSKEVADLVPQVTKLAEAGQVQEALDKLMALEKQTRNAADLSSTSTILTTAAHLAYKSSNYPLLNSTVTVLAKRHGQLKEAVVRMIDEVITFLPEIKTQAGELTWLDALKSLRNITDGKIYLELQRARLTVLLSRYHEKAAETAPPPPADAPPKPPAPKVKPATTADKEPEPEPVTSKDHLERAADLLSDLQVETFSSMDKREKTEFILDQMRLESGRDNWTRVRVGSRKINRKYLKEEGNADLKLRYYALVIALALEEDAFLDACKSYQEVYDTPGIKADEAKSQEALEMIASYVVLAPYDNEQSDMLHKLDLDPAMKKVSLHHDLLKSFTTPELKRWPAIESLYGPTLRQSTVFDQSKKGAFRWEELHKRVIEHNIRTVAGYYTRITLDRLSALLDLPLAQTETTLAALVVDKTVYARIDRPAGVVDFTKKKASDEVLDGWSGDVAKLLGLIEATSHLVNKEYAVHAAIKVSA